MLQNGLKPCANRSDVVATVYCLFRNFMDDGERDKNHQDVLRIVYEQHNVCKVTRSSLFYDFCKTRLDFLRTASV